MIDENEILLAAADLALDYKLAEKSLSHFIRAAWPLLEPGTSYKHNWTIDVICRHLEAVTAGRIKRLVVNIPPGCMKSTIVSVCWPVWHWLRNPAERFMSGSHNVALAIRDALRSRRLIETEWFQTAWGGRFKFTSDQNQKTRYETDKTGQRICFGAGQGVTGERCGIMIFDDPNDVKAMFSMPERERVNNTYDQSLSTRLNDDGAIVGIQQRIHQKDWTGHVTEEEHWEHVVLPMEFEPSRRCRTVLGVQDRRKKSGELLWPSRFPRNKVDEIKRRLGTYGTAGQLQQSPAPMGGGIINIDDFRQFLQLPPSGEILETVQFWDTAQKAKELVNDPWVCGTWIRTKRGLYLADVFRDWMEYPRGKRMVRALADKWRPSAIVIEDKSTGSSILQELRLEGNLPLLPFEPEGDKITRLATESPIIEAGNVFLPRAAPWLADYLAELATFPNSEYKDQADMTSMALKWFRKRGRMGEVRVI